MDEILILFNDFNRLIALGVMVGYIVVDALYAKYTLEVVSLNPVRSANIAALMHILLAYGVLNYTENWLYVIPLVIGSWLGTYLMVRFEKGKK